MIGDDFLKEILARVEKATPGPWESFVGARYNYSGEDFIRTPENDIYLMQGTPDDQEFVAHARQDIPLLIEEIRRLRARAI